MSQQAAERPDAATSQVSQEESRAVAEAARETQWRKPSLAKEL